MSNSQWNRFQHCPNCNGPSNETTSEFVGMISVIMPNQSWVVRYNQLVNRMPGIYATKLLEEIDFEPGETEQVDPDGADDMGDFIVGDEISY